MKKPNYLLSGVALVLFTVVFLLPFAFVFLTAVKTQADSALLDFSLPEQWQLWQNLKDVLVARDWRIALLQEAPPRWLEPLGRRCQASGALGLTSSHARRRVEGEGGRLPAK